MTLSGDRYRGALGMISLNGVCLVKVMAMMLLPAYKYLNSATLYALTTLSVSRQIALKLPVKSSLQVLEKEFSLFSTIKTVQG